MTRLLIALLATSVLVAGCGGDDDESADTNDSPTTAQTQAQTSPTDTGEETTTTEDESQREDSGDDGGGDTPAGTPAQLEQAIEACKENVSQAPQLSEDAKNDLEKLCEEAASGDPEDLREVSREVCKRIIEDTLPEGEQRDQALRLCDQTGEQ